MDDYLKRVVDQEMADRLEAFGAVNVVGPKACGKTTTAEHFSKSAVHFQKDANKKDLIALAETAPDLLLSGAKPRLFDEWQDAPDVWDAVRGAVDDAHHRTGLFILTGSTAKRVKTKHTGTTRITTMEMYPMSLFETSESNGSVSLQDLFNHPHPSNFAARSDLDIKSLIFAICRGGWPETLFRGSVKAKLLIAKDYVKQVYERDMFYVDNVKRSPSLMKAIIRSYARNISTLATDESIMADIKAKRGGISNGVYYDYLDVLKRLYIVKDIEGWCPSIRSKNAIRSGDKREFVDPSIATGALGISPAYLETDFKTLGFLFETLCTRDLRVYSSGLGGEISYYHDRYGLEADAVLHLEDGRYGLFEFKLGTTNVDKGASHLCEIERLIGAHNQESEGKLRLPTLKIVITGGQYAFLRSDGVFVIPIGCLKP